MTNEYTVNVDEKTYHITVEHNNNPSINHTDFSEELSYESTKAEYDHCVQRSEKLDNKVYILLTVYAFLFVLLCDIIKKISCFSFPGRCACSACHAANSLWTSSLFQQARMAG